MTKTLHTLTDVEINRLTALGVPTKVRRDALIALNLNGLHSATRVRNARQRLCDYLNSGRTLYQILSRACARASPSPAVRSAR